MNDNDGNNMIVPAIVLLNTLMLLLSYNFAYSLIAIPDTVCFIIVFAHCVLGLTFVSICTIRVILERLVKVVAKAMSRRNEERTGASGHNDIETSSERTENEYKLAVTDEDTRL